MMTGVIIACGVIAGVSAILHILVHLNLALHPVSSLLATMVSQERDDSDANGNNNLLQDIPTTQLTSESNYLLRSISVVTLIVAVVAGSIGLSYIGVLWGILLGIVVGLAFKLSVTVLIAFLTRRYLVRLRGIVEPSVSILNKITSIGLISTIASYSVTLPGSRQAYYIEVSDFIKTGLYYLSKVHIPQEEKELRMIRGILRMDEVKVSEIMCPRPDIVAVPSNAAYSDVISLMRSKGVTKVPVYENSLDNVNNVNGILFALDLLNAVDKKSLSNLKLTDFLRVPLFVTEFQNVENLLREFKEQRTSIALVVDEHGGVDGLVTLTDVVEEIVGEMMDEFDRDLPEVQVISPNEMIVDAGVSLDQINQALNSDLDGDVNTVGGLIYSNLDKMPRIGDLVDIGPLRMTISNMLGRRIRRVNVKRIDDKLTKE